VDRGIKQPFRFVEAESGPIPAGQQQAGDCCQPGLTFALGYLSHSPFLAFVEDLVSLFQNVALDGLDLAVGEVSLQSPGLQQLGQLDQWQVTCATRL
jgi:hypothetical protein